MKRNYTFLPICLGMLLVSASHVLPGIFSVPIPEFYHGMLLGAGLCLELVGIFLAAKSPAFQNSRLRRWKLRLIGKDTPDDR